MTLVTRWLIGESPYFCWCNKCLNVLLQLWTGSGLCRCQRTKSNISAVVGLRPSGGCSGPPVSLSIILLQLLLQFPCHFEFNLTYLLKLAEHTYSNLFGNFLVNSLAERRRLKIKERTRSIWGYLKSHPSKFRNFLFVRREEVLWPRCEVRDLLLWQDVYMGESSASQVIKEAIASQSGNGSVEESDNGHERDLTEELEKLQVGFQSSHLASRPWRFTKN